MKSFRGRQKDRDSPGPGLAGARVHRKDRLSVSRRSGVMEGGAAGRTSSISSSSSSCCSCSCSCSCFSVGWPSQAIRSSRGCRHCRAQLALLVAASSVQPSRVRPLGAVRLSGHVWSGAGLDGCLSVKDVFLGLLEPACTTTSHPADFARPG